jgi:hypothetical protein
MTLQLVHNADNITVTVTKNPKTEDVERIEIGSWLFYEAKEGRGVGADHLYHVRGSEISPIGAPPHPADQVRDYWTIRRRMKLAEKTGWGCVSCEVEFAPCRTAT